MNNNLLKYIREIDVHRIKEGTNQSILHLIGTSNDEAISKNRDRLYSEVLSRLDNNDIILNQEDNNGSHPLCYIFKYCSKETILAYLEHGSNPESASMDIKVLEIAISKTEKTKYFKRHAVAEMFNNQLLSETDLKELIDYLFSKYNINTYVLTENQDSLLHLTAYNINLFKTAMKYQHNLDVVNTFLEKPLHIFCSYNHSVHDFLFVLNNTKKPYTKTLLQENFLHYLALSSTTLFNYCIKQYPELNEGNKRRITPKEYFEDIKTAYDKLEGINTKTLK